MKDFVTAKHLAKIINNDTDEIIETKTFKTRPQLDEYISKYNIYDMTASQGVEDYKNKMFVGTIWEIKVILPKEEESLKENASCDELDKLADELAEIFSKKGLEPWIDINSEVAHEGCSLDVGTDNPREFAKIKKILDKLGIQYEDITGGYPTYYGVRITNVLKEEVEDKKIIKKLNESYSLDVEKLNKEYHSFGNKLAYIILCYFKDKEASQINKLNSYSMDNSYYCNLVLGDKDEIRIPLKSSGPGVAYYRRDLDWFYKINNDGSVDTKDIENLADGLYTIKRIDDKEKFIKECSHFNSLEDAINDDRTILHCIGSFDNIKEYLRENGLSLDSLKDVEIKKSKKTKKEQSKENVDFEVPQYLYHATYKPFLKSIKEKGLGNTNKKMWSFSKGKGVVYLALDPDVAQSYAEEAEWLDELDDDKYDKYVDNIIILKIDTSKLDKTKLFSDENVLDDDSTLEYHGIIPFNAVVEVIGESFKEEVVNEETSKPESITTQKNKLKRYAKEHKLGFEAYEDADTYWDEDRHREVKDKFFKCYLSNLPKKTFKNIGWSRGDDGEAEIIIWKNVSYFDVDYTNLPKDLQDEFDNIDELLSVLDKYLQEDSLDEKLDSWAKKELPQYVLDCVPIIEDVIDKNGVLDESGNYRDSWEDYKKNGIYAYIRSGGYSSRMNRYYLVISYKAYSDDVMKEVGLTYKDAQKVQAPRLSKLEKELTNALSNKKGFYKVYRDGINSYPCPSYGDLDVYFDVIKQGSRINYDDDVVIMKDGDKVLYKGLWDYLKKDINDDDFKFNDAKGYYVNKKNNNITIKVLDESLNEDLKKNNAKRLYSIIGAEINADYAILSSDTNKRKILDTNAYDESKKTIEEGTKVEGMWKSIPQADSYIIKCDLVNAKKHAKNLCQEEFIMFKFSDEEHVTSQVYRFVDKQYSDYDKFGVSSDEIVWDGDASNLDYYSVINGQPFSFGLYGNNFNLTEDINTSNSVAKEIANKLNLSSNDYNTLLHDINNLRGDEWLEQVKSLNDEELLNRFKVVAQIEDLEEDIEKHDTLNPKLFDGEELKPEVKETVQKIADTFIKELNDDGIRFTLKDIVLLGSNVSYNYTKDSDLDVHLIADSSGLECPDDLYPLLYGAYRSIFNKNYDIKIKDIPTEIYVEMDECNARSNGIYSLNNGWVKHPEQTAIPDLDREAFDKLFKEWEDKYFDLIERVNEELSDDIYDFIEDLYDLRKESIANEGEYGLGNLVFKEFRNLGYLDNLKELRKQEKGKELSLESIDTTTK